MKPYSIAPAVMATAVLASVTASAASDLVDDTRRLLANRDWNRP